MNKIIEQHIETAIIAMFPHGDGLVTRHRVEHHLGQIAHYAYQEGRNDALLGLMTSGDVAKHFGISERRARALIQNRHERFGVGMKAGREWLIHRDELPQLQPNGRYRRKDSLPARPALCPEAKGLRASRQAEQESEDGN